MNKIALSLAASLLLTSTIEAKELRKLDTVTVTAQKVEENPKNVPIAMSIFDEYSIEDKKIDNIQDLTNYVPGFYLFNTSDNGTAAPSMRGVYSDFRTGSPSVAMYIDGIPTLTTTGYNTYLNDIERIEVLKGPQSTLYGKNAEAGVINIITRQPNNETKGKLDIELGEDNKKQLGLSVSGAVIEDKLFIGLAGQYYEKDGFIKNTYLDKDVNDKKHYSGRLNLRYLVNDDLELSLVANKEIRRDGGGNSSTVRNPNPHNIALDLDETNKMDTDSIGFKINYNIDESSSIEAVTAYKKTSLTMIEDFDKTADPSYKQHAFFPIDNKTISQEIRYNLKEDNYSLLLGLYADKSSDRTLNEFDTAGGLFIYGNQKVDGTSLGIFTHLNYKISDNFSILAGLRYDKDTKNLDNRVTFAKEEKSFTEISPKLALKYKVTKDSLIYATIAKGYKPGGYYIFAPQGQEYYDQETLISYEFGLKSSFFENRLNINTALYFISISDKQIVVPLSNIANYIKNAKSATSKGFELDLSYMMNESFSINSSFSYNKATFDDFKYTSLIFDNQYNVIGTQNVDNSGKYMPNTPKYTYSLGTQYRGNNGIYANINLNGFGDFYIDDSNTYKRKAYILVNAKIGYETKDYDIYLYGKNIFDKDYSTQEHYNAGFIHLSKPREIGIQLAYRF
ncbi:TonB-dependent receptor [Sulfurimonas sp.]|uniref:TonB-dependent receptor n=1 Tax=Sulfurimonas sp. TaxID=2022749 RepID=UPI002B478085|nr:TonB-dependent receptor [Sulfurimonas sp.]